MNDTIVWVGACLLGLGFGYLFARGVLSWFVIAVIALSVSSGECAIVSNRVVAASKKIRPMSADLSLQVAGSFVDRKSVV